MADPIKIAGISWYTREDYAACREIMVDKHIFPVSYDAWRKKAERQVQEWESRGFRVIHIHLDAEKFRAWCSARQLDIDAKARICFANEQALRFARN